MRYLLVLGLTFPVALGACARGGSSWRYDRVIRDPSGRDLVAVSCTGSKRFCYVAASKACPSGFAVADSSGRTATDSRGYVTTLPNGQLQGAQKTTSNFEGDLLVRCVPPRAQAREAADATEP
jgi:hypothetical protein